MTINEILVCFLLRSPGRNHLKMSNLFMEQQKGLVLHHACRTPGFFDLGELHQRSCEILLTIMDVKPSATHIV